MTETAVKRSTVIRRVNRAGEDIEIPVVDVRDGEVARKRAEFMIKAANGNRSKYFAPAKSYDPLLRRKV